MQLTLHASPSAAAAAAALSVVTTEGGTRVVFGPAQGYSAMVCWCVRAGRMQAVRVDEVEGQCAAVEQGVHALSARCHVSPEASFC